jgi:hypothetical protein
MRFIISLLILAITGLNLLGQDSDNDLRGTVSYITSQNVYVKFQSTENLKIGDTLFMKQDDIMIPVLSIINLSSISCVCSPISAKELKVSDIIFAKPKPPVLNITEPDVPKPELSPLPIEQGQDTLLNPKMAKKETRQNINGRASVSSYTNFSNADADNSQRMRYTFSFNINNIANSKLSLESYFSFVHSNKNWDAVRENLFNGLKIYNLSLRYDFNETTSLVFGRKINSNLSSVGAIDGLQFEKKIKSISLGAFVGSRPDYYDYSYSFNLLQYGAYVGHNYQKEKKSMQTSVAYVQQQNDGNIDRRFAYFQHANSLIKKVYFFGSIEMDLYKEVKTVDSATNEVSYKPQSAFNLSNLYLLLRYNVTRKLSMSFSYSTRQNIIYYETYKDFLDRLLESKTMQGYRLMLNYRPVKYLSLGLKGGYRFRTNDPKPTRDVYGYATYSRVPLINASATFSVTILESSYMTGNIYSLGLTRDLIPGKVSAGLNYRYVDYNYYSSELPQVQNIGEINISWRMIKKLSLSVYYEGTFENEVTFSRIYANLGYRF